MKLFLKTTLVLATVTCAMSSIAAQNIPALSGNQVQVQAMHANQMPAMNQNYSPVAGISTQGARTSAYSVPVSMYDASASLNDSKPSAYNAPVVNRTIGKQYMCKSGQQVNVLTAGIADIKLNVDGQELLLHKTQYSSWRTFGVFHRPKQDQVDEAEYNTESGLNGAGTVWRQYRNQGALKFYDVEGRLVSTHCEAVS